MKMTQRKESVLFSEIIYDMSMIAHNMINNNEIEVDDSRGLFNSIYVFAKQFREWERDKQDDTDYDYMTAVEEYAQKVLKETYGRME